MSPDDFRIERILHAYVDGELNAPEKSRLLVKMENDNAIRERVCDLRRTKEWLMFSFEHETAPTRSLPSIRKHHFWQTPGFHVAASVLVAILTFGAGWVGHSLQDRAPQNLALENVSGESQHVILHIGESDEARFISVLAKAEQILNEYQESGVQVEVIANGDACSKGLQRLRASGLDPIVISGVDAHEPAADHLIQRLTDGWTYIRI